VSVDILDQIMQKLTQLDGVLRTLGMEYNILRQKVFFRFADGEEIALTTAQIDKLKAQMSARLDEIIALCNDLKGLLA